jgi:hypothetical protein
VASAPLLPGFGEEGLRSAGGNVLGQPVTRGAVSPAVGYVDDVGVSYGLAAVAGLCVVRVAHRWLAWYVVVLVAVLGGGLVLSHTFTNVGHMTAWCIGLGLAVVARAAQRRSYS